MNEDYCLIIIGKKLVNGLMIVVALIASVIKTKVFIYLAHHQGI